MHAQILSSKAPRVVVKERINGHELSMSFGTFGSSATNSSLTNGDLRVYYERGTFPVDVTSQVFPEFGDSSVPASIDNLIHARLWCTQ